MKNYLNKNKNKHLLILIVLYSIYFFNQREVLASFSVLIIALIWWLLHTILRFDQKLRDSLFSLMIYSIPLSFISINGSVDTYVFFNWFNIFSGLYLMNRVWGTVRQEKRNKLNDTITISFLLSFLGLIVSFLVNKDTPAGNASAQLFIILYYLFIAFMVYQAELSNKRYRLDNEKLYKEYNETLLIVSVFVIAQFILYKYFSFAFGRIELFGGNRVAFGFLNFDYSFLSLYIFSGVFFLFKRVYEYQKINAFAFVNVLLLVLASVITSARTGIIALVIIGSVLIALHLLFFNTFKLSLFKRGLIFSMSAIALFMIVYLVGSKRGFYGSGRSESFVLAFEAIQRNVVFGNGLLYHVMNIIPHNFFLQYWLQTGLIFLMPISVLLFLITFKTRKYNSMVFYNLCIILMGAMFIPDILTSRFLLVMIIMAVYSYNEMSELNQVERVAHLVNSGGYSGAEKVLISVIESTPIGFDSAYVSVEGPIEDILKDKKIEHISLPNNSNHSTRKMIVQNDTDIVYAHDFKSSIKSAFLFSDKIVISHIHQNPDWFSKLNIKTLLFLLASLFISKVVYVSEEAKSSFYFSKFIKNKTFVLLNYVNDQ